MAIYVFLAALAGGLSLLCTWVIRAYALDTAILDLPDDRKIHEGAIPRFGGAAVYLAFALAMALAFDAERFLSAGFHVSVVEYSKLMIGGTAMLLVGIYDDIRGMRPLVKLALQLGVAAVMIALGYRIEAISNPFGGTFALGIFAVPVTLLWIVGISNALNLIDGVDGLAAGVTMISAASSFAISFLLGNEDVAVAYAVLFGAALGFLRYNFNPASIFLGDSGSLFLGFLLAVLSIKGAQKGPTSVAITIPILILGLPILDTGVAFFRRSLGGANPLVGDSAAEPSRLGRLMRAFAPDKNHFHHRLLGFGFSHRQVALFLYGVSVVLSALAMLAIFANDRGVAGLLITAAVLVFAALSHLGWVGFRKATAAFAGKRAARALLLTEEPGPGAPETLFAERGYALVRSGGSIPDLVRLRHEPIDVVIVDRAIDGFTDSYFADVRRTFRHAVPVLLRRDDDVGEGAREASRLGAYDWLHSGAGQDRWTEVLRRSFEKAWLMAKLRFFYGVVWLCIIFMPLLIALTFCATRDGVRRALGS